VVIQDYFVNTKLERGISRFCIIIRCVCTKFVVFVYSLVFFCGFVLFLYDKFHLQGDDAMRKILKVKNVSDYSEYLGHTDTHPLISVIDYSEVSPIRHSLNSYDVYGLFLRDDVSVDLTYGFGQYDYKQGTLICVAPGQIGGKEDNGERVDIKGWAMLFHPDLLRGSRLEQEIKNFTFFDYHVSEALHMSETEHWILVSLMKHVSDELKSGKDDYQNAIVVSYIEVILNYCRRFYDRQFRTRCIVNNDLLKKFRSLLQDYFKKEKQLVYGIPSVQYCADKMCMSANYFGDLVRKTTGDTASHYIRHFVVQLAKDLLSAGESIAQTAYSLGFDYPQHLSRSFKKDTGISPKEYVSGVKSKRG